MWRSWVDRINVANKTSPHEQELQGRESITPEELTRREQAQAHLRDLLQQSQDLLSSETERSEVFLSEFLPKFCLLYDEDSGSHSFDALNDGRAFISLLTRQLVGGIRKVPEHKNKADSSEGFATNVAGNQEILVNLMLQQRIPSVIIKLFRSFIDLPPNYYEQVLDEDEDSDMVTLDEASSLIADILKRFVQHRAILRRLIMEDTFFMIVRLMSAKPSKWTDACDTKEPSYMAWKSRTLDILKSVPMTVEVAQYLHSRRCMDTLVQVWKDCTTKSSLTVADHREISLGLDLVCYQLEIDIIQLLAKLVFIGKMDQSPSAFESLPYQHSDFSLPKIDNSKGSSRIVKNALAFQSLVAALIYPNAPNHTPIKSQQNRCLPDHLQATLFKEVKNIICENPINYFMVERLNSLPILIEIMERYNSEIQNGIMDILDYVMWELNFVPLRELAVVSLHLQSDASGAAIDLMCSRFTSLVRKSPKFLTVVREAGLINVVSLMLSDVTESLNQNAANADTNTSNKETTMFIRKALDSFDIVAECMVEMTKDPLNASVFRKTYRGNLFDLLHFPETRIGALQLFECLSNCEETQLEGASDPRPRVDIEHSFSRIMEAIQSIPRNDLDFRLEILRTIKRIFLAHPGTRDIFRRVGGFVSLVSMIVSLEGAFDKPELFISSEESIEIVLDKIISVLQTIFAVLAVSMRDHKLNKQRFVEDIKFGALENALTLTGALGNNGKPFHVFGIMFAFVVDNESIVDIFLIPPGDDVDTGAQVVRRRIETTLKDTAIGVANPEITPCILNLQKLVDGVLSEIILLAILGLSRSSRRNQVKLNGSGLTLAALQRAFPRDGEHENERFRFEKTFLLQIVNKLIIMGVSYEELLYLFQGFGENNQLVDLEDPSIAGLMDVILQGTSRSRWPNFIQFDMNARGFCCMETPNLSVFPTASPGYTIMMWFHIERLDPTTDISLMTFLDGKKIAFRAYIDATSRKLRIQSSTKNIVKFDSFEFHPGYWYHLSLVHYKSRLGANLSTITMHINGVCMEQVRCPYLPQASNNEFFRGVIGTPQELAVPTKSSRLIWDLGPCYLIQDTLETDSLNLYFNLGARYKSLFQDSLRQFQTYEASTSMFFNQRTNSKLLGRKDSAQGMLANVIRSGASTSVSENKIVFAFFACNSITDGSWTGLTAGLSKDALQTISMDHERSRLILNVALPKIDMAIHYPQRMGYLVGDPVVAYPFGLDESMWKIGGCAVVLKLIERSETSAMLCKSTALLFETIRYSWRNSEDMERSHGYEILAYLLKQKRELITIELLELLLVFIGKNTAYPEESVINNPFAYRYVVLNFEIWKKTTTDVQQAQLEQFILFLHTSKRRQFNMRRLQKIHLVKKMLLALRMNVYSKQIIPYVINALKVVMLSNWNTENIRAVATFLASTVSKATKSSFSKEPKSDAPLTITTTVSELSESKIILDTKENSQATRVIQMRNIVMEMLHDILCNAENEDLVSKFAVTITNKWPLLFFAPNINQHTVVLAARILARLLVTQGPTYISKFRLASEGFLVMAELLPHYWNLLQLNQILLTAMMGIDIAGVPLQCDSRQLNDRLRSAQTKFLIPDMILVIIALWKEGIKATNLEQMDSAMSTVKMRSRSESFSADQTLDSSHMLEELMQLFNDLYLNRIDFREALCRQEIIDAMTEILFPIVCKVDVISIAEELGIKEDAWTLIDVEVSTPDSTTPSPIGGRAFFDELLPVDPAGGGVSIIKRGGMTSLTTKTSPHVNKRSGAMLPRLRSVSLSSTNSQANVSISKDIALQALLGFLVNISVQSVIDPRSKALSGVSLLLMSCPPSTLENQTVFESYLLTHIAQNLKSTLQCDIELLLDSRILHNVARFCQMAADAVLQGRFINGAEQTYDLLATVLETLHRDSSSRNDQTVGMLYHAFNRMLLLRISELEQGDFVPEEIVAFLNYCIHHQKIILSTRNSDNEFLRSFCYHLYQFLLSNDDAVKGEAINDIDSFFVWVDSRKVELNLLFKEHIHQTWESVILQENRSVREALKNIQAKRANKLKKVHKRQMYEGEVIREYLSKTVTWSQSIQEVEMSRFIKALQDNDGHENFIRSEWARIAINLVRGRALWGPRLGHSKWRLDYTEGRYRMRKRLQPIEDAPSKQYMPKHTALTEQATSSYESPAHEDSHMQHKTEAEIDKELTCDPESSDPTKSAMNVDNPNIPEHEKTKQLDDDEELSYEEDKNRKVLRLLDQGDMVLEVYNTSRIAGLDAREGLLLLCKNNIYLIDNFFQRSDGEVVEIWDVPKEERDQYLILLARAAGMETEPLVSATGQIHRCRKWANTDLKEVYKRRFLFRDVALEMFFADGRNALITVALSERDELYAKLASRITVYDDMTESIIGSEKEYSSSTLGSSFKLSNIFGSSTLNELTQKWERRDITNFQYLMYLNAIAGRSYNDLTQYPVFPWIVADYTSEELDLLNPSTFRDLTKPMGAQTAERRLEFADRYRQWGETNDPAPAFHYGTHYSSAMIVCSFLIRLEPFTQHYLKLQGGTFDHADRLFDSIGKAWQSASEKNMGDVRELIPEFFYLPDFLENVNKFNFGVKQGTGESIDSVVLPPWAHGDPKIFIQRHREALESEYVSENLHHWIDLIFGYKQQGQAAIDALNVFHHVSYEGAVDLDAITDVVEKTATIGIINNFGQTPRQLFKKPHPARLPGSSDPLALGYYPFQSHVDKLVQSILPVRDINRQIGDMGFFNDRLGVTACQQLFMPSDGQKYIEWGYSDNSLRLFATESGKLLNIFENMHVGYINTACFPDSRTLVTGGTDNVVCMWKIKQDKNTDFTLLESLRGHSAPVTSITSSRSYSILVSGSEDKTAIVWDLNRMQYVRTLNGHESSVDIVRINDTTGDIITCSGNIIRIWTVNGDLYLTKSACPSSEPILSCIFYEGKTNEWSNSDMIITGHRRGIIKVWSKQISKAAKTGLDRWSLVLKREIQQENRMDGVADAGDILSICFTGPKRTMLTGNIRGQVYAYVLPDTTDTIQFVREDKYRECMACSKVFSVLERKDVCLAARYRHRTDQHDSANHVMLIFRRYVAAPWQGQGA
ncbi:hypothetical protein EC973_002599 [Apophysomyces ossiformis]|uniref:Beach-domain-containing protein n=1 Tax=Apophysomyces ossiformis TaxID=679940 RepID=A0A8H7ER42_9FUNG|nr:hypothetical protein EC973_002599 [Apophysomyces ossiformis]